MEVSNDGESFYHRFAASVLCDDMGQPLYSTGPRQQWIQDHWALLHQEANLKVYQNSKPNSTPSTISAVVINQASGPRRREAFEEFFAQLILDQADLCAQARVTSPDSEAEANTQVIVDLFDRYLRYEGHNDQWMACGRAYFAERVRHFILRNIPVQLCIPAFPCKSSNIDKVTGTNPDRGEELALERLHGFVEAIERVYAPGAKLWIISDGHVFSDCIGVDDAAVDEYGAKLKEMNHVIGTRRGNVNRVGFKSLVDLFELAPIGQSAEHLKELANRLDIPNIEHHIDTKHTDEAELCRRILMAACGPSKTAVRTRIESGDPAITALYRGFSRFMLDDLEHHPATQGMSKAQRKKLSARVAFEMILRNQAYSNLVELVFPNHVRLSIHAHNNAGPKFGIQLFDPAHVRAVMGLSPDGELMTSLDLLHIPTPWHNSVVQLEGSDVILITKAKLARASLAAGSMLGGVATTPSGYQYFALRKLDGEGSNNDKGEAKPTSETTSAVSTPVRSAVEQDKRRARRRGTFSEKADAVVTAVVRRNSAAEPATRDTWLAKLRWVMLIFWPSSRW